MRVLLIRKTPEFLRTIWLAARTCYSPLSPNDLLEQEPTAEDMLRIAQRIIASRHLSVLEHCQMTFAVEGVSRTLLAQYSRHRIGVSLSVQSQRYVSEQSAKNSGLFDYVAPPEILARPEARAVLEDAMRYSQQAYDRLLSMGIKKEDARFVLPGGASTNFVTSLNLRSLLDIYEKRVLVKGAQWEIRALLRAMGEALLAEEPWLKTFLAAREKESEQLEG